MSIKNDPPYRGRPPRYPGPENPSSRNSSSPSEPRKKEPITPLDPKECSAIQTPLGVVNGKSETHVERDRIYHIVASNDKNLQLIEWYTDKDGKVLPGHVFSFDGSKNTTHK